MICLSVSNLSVLENLERRLCEGVSVSLLAELERELLRLRYDLGPEEWALFCTNLPKRPLFEVLSQGNLMRRRLKQPQACLPPDVLDLVLSDSFQARPQVAPSVSHLISAWEYSLPASRGVRARKMYFSDEISEVTQTIAKPRILVLGAGHLREAEQWLHNQHNQAEFVAIEPDAAVADQLRRDYKGKPLDILDGHWNTLEAFASECRPFDLIYSVAWFDCLDNTQAGACLSSAMHILRPGGRILAANFAPGSRDAGWMEACWNWRPHYRSEEDLANLANELKQPETRAVIRGHTVFRDESGASAYLEIHSL